MELGERGERWEGRTAWGWEVVQERLTLRRTVGFQECGSPCPKDAPLPAQVDHRTAPGTGQRKA